MIQHTVKFDIPPVNAVIADHACAETASDVPEPETSTPAAAATPQIENATDEPTSETPIDDADVRRDELLDAIALAVVNMQKNENEAVRQWQALAVRFAGIMVKQLTGNSDSIQTDRLTNLVGDLVSRPEIPLRIVAHPDDCSLVQSCLATHGQLASKIELVPEMNVTRGECRAIYAAHDLVSRLEEQLPDIEYRLMEALKND